MSSEVSPNNSNFYKKTSTGVFTLIGVAAYVVGTIVFDFGPRAGNPGVEQDGFLFNQGNTPKELLVRTTDGESLNAPKKAAQLRAVLEERDCGSSIILERSANGYVARIKTSETKTVWQCFPILANNNK